MIVTDCIFDEVVAKLAANGCYGLDTETYGLDFEDKLFSVQVVSQNESYYFNFHDYGVGFEESLLTEDHLSRLQVIFSNPASTFFAHNMVFDLNMLAKSGLHIEGTAWCTQIGSRIANNMALSHSLAACAATIGMAKDDGVEAYIEKHKCSEKVSYPFKKSKSKKKFFDRVPLSIMQEYGEHDARIALELGIRQSALLEKRKREFKEKNHLAKIDIHIETEKQISKVVSDMYMRGICVDLDFTQRCLDNDRETLEDLKLEFIKLTGYTWGDKKSTWPIIFHMLEIPIKYTSKGNVYTKKDFFEELDHPLGDIVVKLRHYEHRIRTYFGNILHYGRSGIVHANLLPHGTITGRFSSKNPNLQNVPKNDEENPDTSTRCCFVPRKDYIFVMIDYDQQELKLLFDYANEVNVIKRILEGEDVHQVTADLAGITRSQAKTINFGLTYGMGIPKLAAALKVSREQAKTLKERHLSSMREVKKFIQKVESKSKDCKFIVNWAGRVLHLEDRDKSYKMISHLIQSSGADVCRSAMVKCHEFLQNYSSALLLQIHDELLFEIHKDELHIVPELKKIMEESYTPRHGLPLTCSVEWSDTSWGDKKPWPNNQKLCLKSESLDVSNA